MMFKGDVSGASADANVSKLHLLCSAVAAHQKEEDASQVMTRRISPDRPPTPSSASEVEEGSVAESDDECQGPSEVSLCSDHVDTTDDEKEEIFQSYKKAAEARYDAALSRLNRSTTTTIYKGGQNANNEGTHSIEALQHDLEAKSAAREALSQILMSQNYSNGVPSISGVGSSQYAIAALDIINGNGTNSVDDSHLVPNLALKNGLLRSTSLSAEANNSTVSGGNGTSSAVIRNKMSELLRMKMELQDKRKQRIRREAILQQLTLEREKGMMQQILLEKRTLSIKREEILRQLKFEREKGEKLQRQPKMMSTTGHIRRILHGQSIAHI